METGEARPNWWKFRQAVKLPLGFFGKLPCYKDFVSIDNRNKACRAVRSWIDRGFSTVTDPENGRTIQLENPAYVFFPSPSDGDMACAYIRQSCDAGGLRPFPIAVFFGLRSRWIKRAEDFPLFVEPLTARLRAISGDLDRVSTVGEFYLAYRGRRLRLMRKCFKEESSQLKNKDLEETIGVERARKITSGWAQLAYRIRKEHSGARALRIELSPDIGLLAQVNLWIDCWLGGGDKKYPLPAVIVHLSDPPVMTAIRGEIRPQDVLGFRHTKKWMEDLCVPEAASPLPPSRKQQAWLDASAGRVIGRTWLEELSDSAGDLD